MPYFIKIVKPAYWRAGKQKPGDPGLLFKIL